MRVVRGDRGGGGDGYGSERPDNWAFNTCYEDHGVGRAFARVHECAREYWESVSSWPSYSCVAGLMPPVRVLGC